MLEIGLSSGGGRGWRDGVSLLSSSWFLTLEKKFEFPSNFPYKYDTAPENQNGDNRGQVRMSPRGFHGLDVWVVVLFCNPWVKIRRSLVRTKKIKSAVRRTGHMCSHE